MGGFEKSSGAGQPLFFMHGNNGAVTKDDINRGRRVDAG